MPPTECRTSKSVSKVVSELATIEFIAAEPWEPPIIKSKGLSALIPNFALAVIRAAAQSAFAISRATLMEGFSGNPTTSAALNFPVLTDLPTAIAPPRNAPNLFAQPGMAFAS